MLSEICAYIHNYFILKTIYGEFTIADDTINADGLLEGQRFRIRGSALNNGVYTYHSTGVFDDDDLEPVSFLPETFSGYVDYMGVDNDVLKIAREISAWMDKYSASMSSPFQSENVIGVYSYTKASGGGSGSVGGNTPMWAAVFGSRLNQWRKVS